MLSLWERVCSTRGCPCGDTGGFLYLLVSQRLNSLSALHRDGHFLPTGTQPCVLPWVWRLSIVTQRGPRVLRYCGVAWAAPAFGAGTRSDVKQREAASPGSPRISQTCPCPAELAQPHPSPAVSQPGLRGRIERQMRRCERGRADSGQERGGDSGSDLPGLIHSSWTCWVKLDEVPSNPSQARILWLCR